MARLRSIVIFISPQPQFMLIFIVVLLFKTNISQTQLMRSQKSTRSAKSSSETYRVNFVLPDELPANHFIGNIPTQLPSFPLGGNLDLSVSTTLLDTLSLAPRFLRTSDSGDLYTLTPIDRDDPDQICGPLKCCHIMVCNLTFTVMFFHPRLDTVTVYVTLQLHDSNDNTPTFPQQTFALWIPEDNALRPQQNTVTSRPLYSLPRAHDADSDPNGIVRYRLTGPYVSKTNFQLINNLSSDQLGIRVRPGTVLDYDYTLDRIFKLTVEATDGGQPARTGQLLLLIHLTDLNDNVPQFDRESDSINIAENTINDDPIYVVHATDADSEDNALIRYTLGPGYVNMPSSVMKHFSLHPVTGALFLRQPFDFEQYEQRKMELRITAYDAGDPPLSSTMLLTVHVHDVNDNPPQLIVQMNRTILENSQPNQLALRLVIRDPDEVSRSLVVCEPDNNQGNSPLRFEKSEDNTMLSLFTRKSFDFETQAQVYSAITCVDAAEPRQIRRFNLTVAIKDANDNVPIFQFLPPHSENLFNITISEGEPINSIVLIVTAVDADSGEYGRIVYSLYELKNKSIQTPIQSKTATFKEYFKINKDTGSIFLIKKLDYELTSEIEFGVRAMDNPNGLDSERNTVSATVRVTIADINDNPPVLISPSVFTIVEHLPVGTKIGSVQFNDSDKGTDGMVKVYGLLPDSGEYIQSSIGRPSKTQEFSGTNYFKLTAENHIVTTHTIDREETPLFHLHILAIDNGYPVQLSTTATITVRVIDINDHKPILRYPENDSIVTYQPVRLNRPETLPLYRINDSQTGAEVIQLSELLHKRSTLDSYVTAPIVQQLQAYDADFGRNSQITYKLIEKCNASKYFHVDKNTGIIRFRLLLNRGEGNNKETMNNVQWIPTAATYFICIQLSDQGEPSLNSNAQFFLKVMNPVESSLSMAQWPADAANLDVQDYIFGQRYNITSNRSLVAGSHSFPISFGETGQNKHGLDINLSNLVISMLLAIFAVTLVCALIAAVLWAHSKHCRRRPSSKLPTSNLGATSHTEASKWLASNEQINHDELRPVLKKEGQPPHVAVLETSQESGPTDLLNTKDQTHFYHHSKTNNHTINSDVVNSGQNEYCRSFSAVRGNYNSLNVFQVNSSLCDLITSTDKIESRPTQEYELKQQLSCSNHTIKDSPVSYPSVRRTKNRVRGSPLLGVKFNHTNSLEHTFHTISSESNSLGPMTYPISSNLTGNCPTHGPHYILNSNSDGSTAVGISVQPTVYAVSSVLDTCGATLHFKPNLEGDTVCTVSGLANLGHVSPTNEHVEKTLSWIPISLMPDAVSMSPPASIICIDPLQTEPNRNM